MTSYEVISLMFQFGMFILALIGLIVSMIILNRKK